MFDALQVSDLGDVVPQQGYKPGLADLLTAQLAVLVLVEVLRNIGSEHLVREILPVNGDRLAGRERGCSAQHHHQGQDQRECSLGNVLHVRSPPVF